MLVDLMMKGLPREKHERLLGSTGVDCANKPLCHHELDTTTCKLRVVVKNYAIPKAAWQGRQESASEDLSSAIPIAVGFRQRFNYCKD